MTDLRCPSPVCNRLMTVLSDDFAGAISGLCGRSKTPFTYPVEAEVEQIRLKCNCGKWLASGVIRAGSARMKCPRCRMVVALTPTGIAELEPPAKPARSLRPTRPHKPTLDERPRPQRLDDDGLLALIEERWQARRYQQSRRSVEIAVGLRFDVFARDGFRCRYCGRGPEQGVFLEADHVTPRSAGGPDTLANLVTACWDCNQGKKAKILAS